MSLKDCCISLVFLLFAIGAYAQEERMEMCIDFRVNKTNVDPSFSDNAFRIREIISFLQHIRKDSTIQIIEVSFCGAASPEGSDQINRRLARGRLTSLEKLVRQEVEIPDSVITRNDSYIPWDNLKSQIKDSKLSHKEEVLAILGEKTRLVDYHHPNTHVDNRIVKLKQLDGGKVWQQINRQFFSSMRNACVVLVAYLEKNQSMPELEVISERIVADPEPVVIIPEPIVVIPEPVVEQLPDTLVVVEPVVPVVVQQPEEWTRQLYVKTNLLGLGLAIANAGVEVDLNKHWSFTFPIHYSAWNYFKQTVKFRTLSVQPECRYWFHPENEGWFVGAHFGLAYYNIATNGDKRYQDHDGKSPSIGGGISLGFRTPLSADQKWHLEFVLGGGVYDTCYDRFYNVKDGKLIDTTNKMYWGVDNVAVNICYQFNLNKRKR